MLFFNMFLLRCFIKLFVIYKYFKDLSLWKIDVDIFVNDMNGLSIL